MLGEVQTDKTFVAVIDGKGVVVTAESKTEALERFRLLTGEKPEVAYNLDELSVYVTAASKHMLQAAERQLKALQQAMDSVEPGDADETRKVH